MIDIKTFMLVLGIGNIGFAMLMVGYSRGASANAAIRLWYWSKLVEGGAHLLGWLRPEVTWVALSAAANTALIGGIALEVAAYCTFFGVISWKRTLYPATLLAVLAVHGARFGGMAANHLIVLVSVMIAALAGTTSFILLRPGTRGSVLQRVMGANVLLFFLAMSMRAYTGIVDASLTVFTPNAVQTFTYLTGYLLMIVNGFGFLLLCKEQDDRKMALLASVDSLTGLVNRRAFFERTGSVRMLTSRLRKPISLLMVDIDHFKRLNDKFGHACGDEALCVFARTAQGTLREHDILGRMGGEEFALVLPGTDLQGATQAAERLRAAVDCTPVPNGDQPFTMTVSIGVAMIHPDEHINAALARADHTLYAAKKAGRNRVETGEAARACA